MNEKMSINLLPGEVVLNQAKQKRFLKIQAISVGIVLFFIFITSTTFALRIIQSQNTASAREGFDSAQAKVTQFSAKEAQLNILKNRINLIDSFTNKPSKQRAMFNLVSNLIPAAVIISTAGVDHSGNVILSAIVPDTSSLEEVLTNLLDREKNENRIAKVDLESLSRGREGGYRVNLKITAK